MRRRTELVTWQPTVAKVGTQSVVVRATHFAGSLDQECLVSVALETTPPTPGPIRTSALHRVSTVQWFITMLHRPPAGTGIRSSCGKYECHGSSARTLLDELHARGRPRIGSDPATLTEWSQCGTVAKRKLPRRSETQTRSPNTPAEAGKCWTTSIQAVRLGTL